MKKQTKGIEMDKKNKDQLEYYIRYANEVLENAEQFTANIEEGEKDDMKRLLGWLKKSLEDMEPILERNYDILRIAKLRIRIMKLLTSF